VDAGGLFGSTLVYRADAGMGVRRKDEHRVRLTGEIDVGDKTAMPGQKARVLLARDGLSDAETHGGCLPIPCRDHFPHLNSVAIQSDFLRLPGRLNVMFHFGEARRNEIRSQPTRRAECRAYQAGEGLAAGAARRGVGLQPAVHQRPEQRRRNPTVVTLYELATALGVSHMDLVRPSQEE
jgi:hypothetical protein